MDWRVADAEKLTRMIDRFREEPDGWRDETLRPR